MPIPDFPNMDNFNDAKKRQCFVLWVKQTLSELATEEEYEQIFADTLIGLMRNAWGDVEQSFDELAESVVGLDTRQVEIHGLSGNQLDFKLATVRYWAQQFNGRAAKSVLRRLLNAINTLLVSLATAAGAGTILQEMKDAIKDAIDEDNDN